MKRILTSVLLFLVVFMFQNGNASASLDTCTWTGSGSDSFVNNGANWSCDLDFVEPDDSLVFPAGPTNKNVVFDFVPGPTPFGAITFEAGGYTLSGSSIAPGSIIQSTGSLTQDANNTIGNDVDISAGSATVSLIAPGSPYSGILTISGAVNLGGNTLNLAPAVRGTIELSGAISGTGGLSITGAGTVLVSAANTFSGGTGISGTLVVNGTVGNVSVLTGGKLKGGGTTGTITAASGGSVAPGTSPGCLNSGNASFVAGSSFDVEIAGTTVCTQYDQLVVTGSVNLGGATLNTSFLSGFVPATGNTFTIISNDAADATTGTFTGLAEGASLTVGGTVFTISYVGGDGNDVVLTVQSSTPVAPVAPIAPVAVPGTPNTGIKAILASPLAGLAVIAMAAGLGYIARRQFVGQRIGSK